MKRTISTIIVLSWLASPCLAWDSSKYSSDRQWQTSVRDDPFNGRSIAVQAPAFKDGGDPGLITIRKAFDQLELSIVDVSEFYCPEPGESHLRVRVWFSDTKQVAEMEWEVDRGNNSIYPYASDGAPIIERMLTEKNTIFRVIDGCGDVTDYKVSATNGREELSAAGF